jgi:mono/diheme cytochrome c family protein
MKNKKVLISMTLLAGCFLTQAVIADPVRITLPAETASFRLGPGAEMAMAQCLQCHSAEYITTQPPLGREAWMASIQKMRGKYGAVISPEAESALLEYLVGNYGSPAKPIPLK